MGKTQGHTNLPNTSKWSPTYPPTNGCIVRDGCIRGDGCIERPLPDRTHPGQPGPYIPSPYNPSSTKK